jgi:hypothetical protein
MLAIGQLQDNATPSRFWHLRTSAFNLLQAALVYGRSTNRSSFRFAAVFRQLLNVGGR